MQFLLVTILTVIVAVFINPLSKKVSHRVDDKRYLGIHVHHSVTGLLICAAGLIMGNKVVAAIGFGLYLAHGVEEIYYNKRKITKAFFIFITR